MVSFCGSACKGSHKYKIWFPKYQSFCAGRIIFYNKIPNRLHLILLIALDVQFEILNKKLSFYKTNITNVILFICSFKCIVP